MPVTVTQAQRPSRSHCGKLGLGLYYSLHSLRTSSRGMSALCCPLLTRTETGFSETSSRCLGRMTAAWSALCDGSKTLYFYCCGVGAGRASRGTECCLKIKFLLSASINSEDIALQNVVRKAESQNPFHLCRTPCCCLCPWSADATWVSGGSTPVLSKRVRGDAQPRNTACPECRHRPLVHGGPALALPADPPADPFTPAQLARKMHLLQCT